MALLKSSLIITNHYRKVLSLQVSDSLDWNPCRQYHCQHNLCSLIGDGSKHCLEILCLRWTLGDQDKSEFESRDCNFSDKANVIANLSSLISSTWIKTSFLIYECSIAVHMCLCLPHRWQDPDTFPTTLCHAKNRTVEFHIPRTFVRTLYQLSYCHHSVTIYDAIYRFSMWLRAS